MSELIISLGGGGGLDTDECTAFPEDVLKGKMAGCNGFDEPVAGTLELTGNAADSQVLSGQTYYNTDAKKRRTGTMVNRGAVSQTLNCGGAYTIPAGYHNGSGKVKANSLAGQTGGATAEDRYVLNGKTYWKDGEKRTGTMASRGAVSRALNCGEEYVIPPGYHNGEGKVKTNSLAGQTGGTAAAGDILSGKTAWVNGVKVTGTKGILAGGTYTPKAAQQIISCSGKAMTSDIIIAGDADLIGSNIRNTANIFGVQGSLSEHRYHVMTIKASLTTRFTQLSGGPKTDYYIDFNPSNYGFAEVFGMICIVNDDARYISVALGEQYIVWRLDSTYNTCYYNNSGGGLFSASRILAPVAKIGTVTVHLFGRR